MADRSEVSLAWCGFDDAGENREEVVRGRADRAADQLRRRRRSVGQRRVAGALRQRSSGAALVSERAVPGQKVRVAIQVYGKVQGGDRFSEGNWTIIEPKRARETLKLKVHPEQLLGPVPNGIVGLSQGGGMSDYEAATAKKLREGGFKWFRMDNVLTGTLKKGADGKLVDDWGDFDKRLDFMAQIGAEPIICVSYMPQVLDAVPNGERQSARAITASGKSFVSALRGTRSSAAREFRFGKCGMRSTPAGSSPVGKTPAANPSRVFITKRWAKQKPTTR